MEEESVEKLILECPRCKQVARYGGYPPEPQLSLVLCLECGHVAPGGAFRRVGTQETLTTGCGNQLLIWHSDDGWRWCFGAHIRNAPAFGRTQGPFATRKKALADAVRWVCLPEEVR